MSWQRSTRSSRRRDRRAGMARSSRGDRRSRLPCRGDTVGAVGEVRDGGGLGVVAEPCRGRDRSRRVVPRRGLRERLSHGVPARWTAFEVEPYGLEISPELAALARHAASAAGQSGSPSAMRSTGSRRASSPTSAPVSSTSRPARRRELVKRLLASCERLIVGVFNEHESERTTESLLESWGVAVAGRSARANSRKPGMEYRVLWIDS